MPPICYDIIINMTTKFFGNKQIQFNPVWRFWQKVDKKSEDECWNWLDLPGGKGYGEFWINGKNEKAHRVSWEIANKKSIPDGIMVLHKCDNRICVNPNHLFLGTAKDNAIDRETKGRGNKARGESHGKAKLTTKIVIEIRQLYKQGIRQIDLSKIYNVDRRLIYIIVHNKTWKWLDV